MIRATQSIEPVHRASFPVRATAIRKRGDHTSEPFRGQQYIKHLDNSRPRELHEPVLCLLRLTLIRHSTHHDHSVQVADVSESKVAVADDTSRSLRGKPLRVLGI